MSHLLAAGSWATLITCIDDPPLEILYEDVICQIASESFAKTLDQLEAEGEDTSEMERPDLTDPSEVFAMVCAGDAPPWWPKVLGRLEIEIRTHPDNGPPERYGPRTHDPNISKSHDLGKAAFLSHVEALMSSVGVPFEGQVSLDIRARNSRKSLRTWRRTVAVGPDAKAPKHRSGRGRSGGSVDYGEEGSTARERYLEKQVERTSDELLRMSREGSHLLNAAAGALNATRGVNMSHPYGQNGEDQPMWMKMIEMVTGVVVERMSPGDKEETPQEQYRNQQRNGPAQLTDRSATNDYMQGEYDFMAEDDDVLYEEYDEEYEESDEEYEEGDDPGFFDEEEEYDPADRKSQNPLDNMSPEELQQHLNSWIDRQPDKAKVKKLGWALAKKIM